MMEFIAGLIAFLSTRKLMMQTSLIIFCVRQDYCRFKRSVVVRPMLVNKPTMLVNKPK